MYNFFSSNMSPMNLLKFYLLTLSFIFASTSIILAQSSETSIERKQIISSEDSFSEVSAAKQALKEQFEKPELQASNKKSKIVDIDREAILNKIKYLLDLNCCEDEISKLTSLLNSPRN